MADYLGSNDWMTAPESTGTTVIAVAYDGGVVVGADSRTSMGTYSSNRVTNKLTRITDNIYCCRSGSAADTTAIADIVSYSMNFHENQTGQEPLVVEAAAEFRSYCYNYRNSLTAGIIVAGYDTKLGGQVYSIPIGGMCVRQKYTIGGSGSSYIYSFVREFHRDNMTEEECVDFVKRAVMHAMHFDGSSGGVCRIGILNKKGMTRQLHYAPIPVIATAEEMSAVPTVVGV